MPDKGFVRRIVRSIFQTLQNVRPNARHQKVEIKTKRMTDWRVSENRRWIEELLYQFLSGQGKAIVISTVGRIQATLHPNCRALECEMRPNRPLQALFQRRGFIHSGWTCHLRPIPAIPDCCTENGCACWYFSLELLDIHNVSI